MTDPFGQLAMRLGQKTGYQCLGSSREVGEAIAAALTLLEELDQKPDAEKVFDTTFTVAEAKQDNRVFGQIVFLRMTGVAKTPD